MNKISTLVYLDDLTGDIACTKLSLLLLKSSLGCRTILEQNYLQNGEAC